MVISQLRQQLADKLRHMGCDAPGLEARELLCAALGISRRQLTLLPHDAPVDDAACRRLSDLLGQREQGKPLQYVLGEWDFYGRTFFCSEQALIPRPETELLVEQALPVLRSRPGARVLDLGCGTGCIGLTLALESPCTVTLADLSEQALALARRNAERLCAKAEFLRLDMLAPPPEGWQWELIVSNPPYLTGADMLALEPAVRFEPAMALFGGEDGLAFYRALAGLWVPALAPGGMLLVEHGMGQGAAVAALFSQAGLQDVRRMYDREGRDRMVAGVRARRGGGHSETGAEI